MAFFRQGGSVSFAHEAVWEEQRTRSRRCARGRKVQCFEQDCATPVLVLRRVAGRALAKLWACLAAGHYGLLFCHGQPVVYSMRHSGLKRFVHARVRDGSSVRSAASGSVQPERRCRDALLRGACSPRGSLWIASGSVQPREFHAAC